MTIALKDNDLVLDQSLGLQDGNDTPPASDIQVRDDGDTTDDELATLASGFYSQLDSVGLVDATGFSALTGGAASVDDFVTVDADGVVDALRFTKNANGDDLDGQQWMYDTDPTAGINLQPVLTIDDEAIYIYSILNGQMMIASTEDPATMLAKGSVGGTIGGIDAITDFDSSKIVLTAWIEPAGDNKSAEVYMASHQPIAHFIDGDDSSGEHNDVVDLANNLWITTTASTSIGLDELESQKFLFGMVSGNSATERLFLIGKDYQIKADETLVNGNGNNAMNTSQGGSLPGIKKVATVGINNQKLDGDANPLTGEEGVYLMLTDTPTATPMTPGSYHDGDDLFFETVETFTSLDVTIVQLQGNTAPAMRISGYLNGGLTPDNTIEPGSPELGQTADLVALTTVKVFEFGNPVAVAERSVTDAATTSSRGITITFQKADGSTWVHGVDAANLAVFAVVENLAAADVVSGTWAGSIDHELVEATVGGFDIGRIEFSDAATLSANVGAEMFVQDAGPTAVLDPGTDAILHDETAGVDTVGGANDIAIVADVEFDAFGTVIGMAQTTAGVVVIDEETVIDDEETVFGTDAPTGTKALTLEVTTTVSGLKAITDPNTGATANINLYLEANETTVTGRIGDASSKVAFAFRIETDGDITLAQYLPILNVNAAGTANQPVVSIANDAVKAVLTVTDDEGDFAVDKESIGSKIQFRDDGLSPGTTSPIALEEDDINNSSSIGLNEDGSSGKHQDLNRDLNNLFTVGIDKPATFSMDAGDIGDLPSLTSNGEAVDYDVFEDTVNGAWVLTAYVDNTSGGSAGELDNTDRVIFTWDFNNDGTDSDFILIDQLDMDTPLERNEANADDDDQEETTLEPTPSLRIDLSEILVVKDRDFTTVTPDNLLEYTVQDDMPDIGDNGANNVAADADEIPDKIIAFAAGDGNGETTLLQTVIGTDEEGAPGVTIETFDQFVTFQDDQASDVLDLIGVRSGDKKMVKYFEDENGDSTLQAGETKEYFRLTVHDDDTLASSLWNYEWEAFQPIPATETPIDFNAIKSSGPQEILSPPVGTGGKVVQFDGLLFDGAGETANDWGWALGTTGLGSFADPAGDDDGPNIQDLPLSDLDDGNPDAEGFGIKRGQASNFNHNEGFLAAAFDGATPVTMSSLSFAIEAIGSVKAVHIDWQIIDGGEIVDVGTQLVDNLPSGNNEVPFEEIRLDDGSEFDAVIVRVWLDGAPTNKGIRLLDFKIGESRPIEDKLFNWTVQIEDADGDFDVASFETGVDGSDGDGLVSGVDDGFLI